MFPVVVAVLVFSPSDLEAKLPPPDLAIPSANLDKARDLVQQLGDPSFRVRDKAFADLKKMSRMALPEVQKAAETEENNQIRLRCQDMLPELLALDFEARLFSFLNDTQDKYKHDLPGWKEFRKAVDYHPLARETFLSLLKQPEQRTLFSAIHSPKGEFTQRLIARKVDLYQQMYTSIVAGPAGVRPDRYEPTIQDLIGLLFADIIAGDTMVQGVGVRAMTPYMMVTRANLRTAIQSDKYGPLVKSLAEEWIETRTTSTGLTQAMSMATTLGLSNVPVARKILSSKAVTPNSIAQAVCVIAQHGKKEDAAELAKLYDREEQVYPGLNGAQPIQLRDVAFAMTLNLTDRKPTDYHMTSRYSGEATRYYYYSYSFPSAEDRMAAFEQFKKEEPAFFKK